MKHFKSLLICLIFSVFAQAQINTSGVEVELKNEEGINSENLEFSPVFYKDGLVFTTTQNNKGRYAIEDTRIGQNIMSIWWATRNSEGKLETPMPLSKELQTDVHELAVTFNSSGEIMYFTRNDFKSTSASSNNNLKKLNVYSTEMLDGKWGNAVETSFNEDGYNTIHPTVHPDLDELYFSSDRPGGYGGYDLYFVRKVGGEWSSPINLGPQVNTPDHEVFPFIHPDNTLYFASTGHGGMGGLDVFYTNKNREIWKRPINLGEPFNSSSDDLGFILDRDKKNGYLSSDRAGGKGGDDIYSFSFKGTSPLGSNEILVTVIDGVSNQGIEGSNVSHVNLNQIMLPTGDGSKPIIIDKLGGSNTEFSFVIDAGGDSNVGVTDQEGKYLVNLADGQYAIRVSKPGYLPYQLQFTVPANDNSYLIPLDKAVDCVPVTGTIAGTNVIQSGVTVVIKDVETREEQRVITDANGAYEYCLKCNREYEVYALKGIISSNPTIISTINKPCNESLVINRDLTFSEDAIRRIGQPGNGGGTYPAFDENGNPIGAAPIKKGTTILLPNIYYNFNDADLRPDAMVDLDLVKKMLEMYPDMQVELVSHTDSRGSDGYNQQLSERRSQRAVEYLENMGVPQSRVIPVGMGERKPRNRCINGRKCSEEEHQENRRTEIKVIELGNASSYNNNQNREAVETLTEYTLDDRGDNFDNDSNYNTNTSEYDVPTIESSEYREDIGGSKPYYVIAGTFRSDGNAQSRLTKVRDMGYYNAEVILFDYPSYHAVCVDKFGSEDEARDLVSRLQSNFGIESYVRRME